MPTFIYVRDVTLPEHLAGRRGQVVERETEFFVDLLREGYVLAGDTLPAEQNPTADAPSVRTIPKDLSEVDPFAVAASGERVYPRPDAEEAVDHESHE